jgi:4-hydroxybenzoate polyprenyltransferase
MVMGVNADSPRQRIPPPVRPRRAWFVFALTAVIGTIAAALLPSPWSIVCGVLAALGATGAFAMFVAIVVLEDSPAGTDREDPPRRRRPLRQRGRGDH